MTGVFAVGFAVLQVHAAPVTGDIEKGKQKVAQICNACHGLDGNGVAVQTIWPKLAGQNANYIYKQLNNFKIGDRHNAQMTPMALPLTDEEMRNVAVYFQSQTQKGGTAKPELVALGESIYRAGNPANGVPACSGCHGPAGLGNDLAKFPRLAGQHADYITQTLKLFRAMERENDPNGMMRGVTARLTDAEMAAVAQYIQGLRP
ncbi:c-type cytochrome [Thiospirillum jenense]|nr:c-type cytochrome [Thiospirillum jenense]